MQNWTELYDQTLYRIHDPKEKKGCFEVKDLVEAHQWNAENWGIFWPVNEFVGARKKENLKQLRAWFVECDSENKKTLLSKLNRGLSPSMIVESKRGFHAYWFCDDSATTENYSDIIEFNLVPHFGGDPNAKDISRILRAVDYFHCKDPTDRFFIRLIHSNEGLKYSEGDMLKSFPIAEKPKAALETKHRFKNDFGSSNDLWERVYNLDCEEALTRLSGTSAVNGERYTFRKTSRGLNIIVNGKATGCWIDASRRIGSTDKGGPTIFQWLNWFHRDNKTSYNLLKQNFPELFDGIS